VIKKVTLFFLSLFWSFFVGAGGAGKTVLEIEQESLDVKKAVQTAIEIVSFELMEQFIEPSKLKEQKKQIQKIISTYSNRYILYTKTGSVIETSTKDDKESPLFIVPVTIGFSEENLKKILLEEDLFYSGVSQLRILPLILLENVVDHQSYGWWLKNKSSFMERQMHQFYDHLQKSLLPYGFFVINPEFSGSKYFIPEVLSFTRPKKRNVFKLAKFFNSNLVMTGSIKIRDSDVGATLHVKMELTVYHAESGRLLAEVERLAKIPVKDPDTEEQVSIEQDRAVEQDRAGVDEEKKQDIKQPLISLFLKKQEGFAKGLGTQLRSIYEAGQIASNLLKITVNGNLSYKDSLKFQNLLASRVSGVKGLKEHIIKSGSITYISSTRSSVKSISNGIKKSLFPNFNVRVVRAKRNELVLQVSYKN